MTWSEAQKAISDKNGEIERLKEENAAEIERLKEELKMAHEVVQNRDSEIERLTRELREEREAFLSRQLHDTTLITELCNALDGPRFDAIEQRRLVERAREATR